MVTVNEIIIEAELSSFHRRGILRFSSDVSNYKKQLAVLYNSRTNELSNQSKSKY
jgi:hypothetical protein